MPERAGRFTPEAPLEPAEVRLVAVADGEVAGLVELIGAHVANLFVDPARQGRGIGSALLAAAEARVAGDVTLSVFTVNPDARRLYERLGYVVEGRREISFAGAPAEVWRMRKLRTPPYRLVIFDFDGTLADSAEWMIGVLNQVAVRYGFRTADAAEIERLRGRSSRQIVKALGVPAWKLPAIAKHMRALSAEAPAPLFPGVPALLERLAAAGVETAVVSSNAEANVRRALGPAAATVGRFACEAAMFGKARKLAGVVRAAGVPRGQVLSVGDETRDVEAARKAGLASAAVTWGYATEKALAAARPDRMFRRLDDLAAVLAPG
nr:GNAT family N-acetyltransferase [Caulobacter sp. 17J80-11]